MTTLNNAIARLEELLALNPSYTKTKLKAFLLIDDYSNAIIKEALEAVAPSAARPNSFRDDYYNYLVNNPLATRKEAEAFIRTSEFATPNVIKHLTAFLRDYDLVKRVRDTVLTEANEEQEKDTRSEAHKQAYKTHDDIKEQHENGKQFTKSEASKAHPDKVAKFNDDKLTEMYNTLYKSLNIKARARKAA